MKLFFNLIFIFFITNAQQIKAQAILMSGRLSPLERELAQNVTRKLLGESKLIKWEQDNLNCNKKTGYLLQLCWHGKSFSMVYQKRGKLEKSIGRLIEMKQTEKAFELKASL
jgi:hypothetical protein